MIAVIFGPPGSGKGTQAARVAARLRVPHIATGDILREEVACDTKLGREVEPIMRVGKLVPDDLVVRVIESSLSRPAASGGAILDGYPRTIPQAIALDAMLARRAWCVDVLLSMRVHESVLRERVLRRAENGGRADDTPDALDERMAIFRVETAPVLDRYAASRTPIEEIDGLGTIDEVSERITRVLLRSS